MAYLSFQGSALPKDYSYDGQGHIDALSSPLFVAVLRSLRLIA
jgi:hypothetical protein